MPLNANEIISKTVNRIANAVVTQHHNLAVLEACRAPAISPTSKCLFTLDAKTMAAIPDGKPSGKQQQVNIVTRVAITVDTMAQTI